MKEVTNYIENEKKKRVYKNSLLLFVRIFIITIINLYSVRLVVNGLGVKDYGIFNAVVGVVMTLSCVFPVIAVSVQRFFSSEMGKNNYSMLPIIFSASINIILVLLLIIIILLETIGIYIINSKMQIPVESIGTVHYIFHLSIFTFIFSFIQIPFIASIFAHEDMNIFAFISCIDCALKLIASLFINYVLENRLLLYAGSLTIVSFCTFLFYMITCKSRYKECCYTKVKEIKIYKEMLSFSGWTMYGAFAGICMIQGNTILLNIYFGPLANTAFGIANNIYNAFNSLANSIVLAFRPRMIKTYAAKNYSDLSKLFTTNNKFIFTLLIIVAIPIFTEIDTIIQLWLGKMSENMVLYSRLFILYSIILALHNPITTIIQASGKIKIYHLCVESITIMSLPTSWFLFKLGMPSYSIFGAMIILALFGHVVRFVILRRNYSRFSCYKYAMKFILPSLVVASLSSIGAIFIHTYIEDKLLRLVSMMTICPIWTLVLTYIFNTSKEEKFYIHKKGFKIIKNIIERK